VRQNLKKTMISETVSFCRSVEIEGRNPPYLLELTERSTVIFEQERQENKGLN
jgi:hypothetical protein